MMTIDPYVACSNLNPVSFSDFAPSFVLRLLASACRLKASKWAEKNHHVGDAVVRKCTAGNVDPIMFYRCGLHPILCHGRFSTEVALSGRSSGVLALMSRLFPW